MDQDSQNFQQLEKENTNLNLKLTDFMKQTQTLEERLSEDEVKHQQNYENSTKSLELKIENNHVANDKKTEDLVSKIHNLSNDIHAVWFYKKLCKISTSVVSYFGSNFN